MGISNNKTKREQTVVLQQASSVVFTSKEDLFEKRLKPPNCRIVNVYQSSKSELIMIGSDWKYQINLDNEKIEEFKVNTSNVLKYFYYQKLDFNIYVSFYKEFDINLLRVFSKDNDLIFQSKEVIKMKFNSSEKIIDFGESRKYNRSVCLLDSRLYGLSIDSELLMFDIDELKNNPDYKAVVIEADTPLSDIVLDGNTLMCLNENGPVSRIDCSKKHKITQKNKLSDYTDKDRFYFTIAVKGSVMVVASGKEMKNRVDLLDHKSFKSKASLENLSEESDSFSTPDIVMQMKIFEKKNQTFIIGARYYSLMHLLGVNKGQLNLLDTQVFNTHIYFVDELLRSKDNKSLIELIVGGSDNLHHIVTIAL